MVLLKVSLLAAPVLGLRSSPPGSAGLFVPQNFYDVTAQPNIVMVSTKINKPMLATLSTFP
jgi:hypothetical protein